MTGLFRRTPLSVRLATATAAAFLALLAVIGVVVYQQLGDGLRAGIDQQLFDIAVELVPRTVDELDDQERNDEVDDLADELEVIDQEIQLIDGTDQLIFASGELRGHPPLVEPAALARVRRGEGLLRTVSAPRDDRGPLRLWVVSATPRDEILLIAADLAPVAQAQQALLAVYGPVAVLASALAGLLGYGIARRGLAPISRVTAEASDMGAGDLSRRLPEPDRLDEVGRLIVTLNGMLGRLDAAMERERQFTADARHELRTPSQSSTQR